MIKLIFLLIPAQIANLTVKIIFANIKSEMINKN